MRVAIHNNWLRGFKFAEGDLEICHLLYADDIIIFCEAVVEQVSYIRVMLVVFEAISGLKVNWRKKQYFPYQRGHKTFSLLQVCSDVVWIFCLVST